MGMIRIEMRGSFGVRSKEFSAMEHGHADAVAQAIEWLSGDVLPLAIRTDHQLHERDEKPSGPFGHNVEPKR